MTESTQGFNVAALLQATSSRSGGGPAVVDPDGRAIWSFAELAEGAACLAGGLRELGVGVGDRVLILEPDLRRRYELIAAALWAGAAVVVPPASLRPWEAVAAAADAAPRAVVFGPLLWPAIVGRRGLRSVPLRIATGGPRPPGAVALADLERCGPVEPQVVPSDAPALVSFTTGSTGPSKLVIRSHGVLRAQHDALRRLRALSDTDRDFVGLSNLVLHNLGSGVTSILPPGGPASRDYGVRVARSLAATRATSAAGFPHLFAAAARSWRRGSLDRLRTIHIGGSRVAPSLLGALARLAPAARVTVVYGSTEIEPIAAIEAAEYLHALASSDPSAGVCVGRVVPGIELRIEATGPDAESGTPTTAGVILARGPRVAGTFDADGWAVTGDVGWLDADGRLWLLGRTENTLGSVHPFQVERAVEALDWVRSAALVRLESMPKPRGVLAVEPLAWDDPGTRAGHLASMRQLLTERGWAIDEVVLVQEMPTTRGPAAKVDVARLRRRSVGR